MTLTPRAFRRHLERTFPSLKGHHLLVACSGGVDSMVLLHLLSRAADAFQLTLSVAYVNHRLRPEAKEETLLVEQEAKKLNISFVSLSFSEDFWNEKGNMEERARQERYKLLAEHAQKEKISAIATAHHADDQIETLLMRLLDRGTGIKGLSGILPDRILNNSRVIRPLLVFSKNEIIAYQTENDIPYAEDSSNHDTAIRRNLFRHNIIPALETQLGKPALHHLSILASNVQDELKFNTFTATLFWQQWQTKKSEYTVPFTYIKQKSVNFWTSALRNLLPIVDTSASLSRSALEDCATFLIKQQKKSCNAHPLVITMEQDFMEIKVVQKNNK